MIKILVIEDEKRVADLLKIGLEENGYQVLVAYDGEMGWRLFQSNDFQLIISDIILPKLNGFELCQKIRKADEEIPILMLTALGTADDKLEGFDVGADAVELGHFVAPGNVVVEGRKVHFDTSHVRLFLAHGRRIFFQMIRVFHNFLLFTQAVRLQSAIKINIEVPVPK